VFIATEHRTIETIGALYALGHRDFAEKFVQEAEAKDILGLYPDINLHYFGCMQRNKIRKAIRLFDCVESLDNEKAAAKLKLEMEANAEARLESLLVQVNTGREPQKRGVSPGQMDALLRFCADLRLPLKGLMAIPPKYENPETHFRFLRKTADRFGLEDCFMGMSADFEPAINLGSTAIRVGKAIFSGKLDGIRENPTRSGLGVDAPLCA
jgi:PLP dependent protein